MITDYFFYIIKKSIIITRKNFNIYKREFILFISTEFKDKR